MISPIDHQMYIDGAWAASASGARLTIVSPATGKPIGTIPEGTRADAQRAIAAANAATRNWSRRTPFDRAEALERVADIIRARRDDLATTLTAEQGKPLYAEAYAEVDDVIQYFRMAAA